MRVGIVALLQESNTFVAGRTTLEHFEADVLARGSEVATRFETAPHEVGGFLEGLAAEGVEAAPVFAARALPFGVIDAGTFERLLSQMREAITQAGPLDGLLAAPHGATVADGHPDADGYWLGRARAWAGGGPLVATLDLHANLSRAMLQACDALVSYRTNPHVDQRARGVEAASLLVRVLRGGARPCMAAARPPMAIGIERQLTAEPPSRLWHDLADDVRGRAGVLAVSLLHGFPYADVPDMGSSVVVATDGDAALARRSARELADHLWMARRDFVGELVPVDAAVRQAAAHVGRVCLLDMGDNVGGGSPGDGTVIAAALHRETTRSAFVSLYDPVSAARARLAGAGATLDLSMGGRFDDRHGLPLDATVTVRSAHDGRFREPRVRHGGVTTFDQGPTAVVLTERGLTIMLTSRRVAPWSLEQLRGCDLEPTAFDILVAKGVHAPVEAYREVCDRFIRVDTPGVTCADMTRLTYRHRRRPMFPFERGAVWSGEVEP